jgi:hypothetical protein
MRSGIGVRICGLLLALMVVLAAPGAVQASVDRSAEALPTVNDLPGAASAPVPAPAWFARLTVKQRKRAHGKPAGVRLTVAGTSVVGFAAVLRDKATAKKAAAALSAASPAGDAIALAGLGGAAGTPVTRSVFAAGAAVVELAGPAGSTVLPGVVAQVQARVSALAAQSRWQALQAQAPAKSTRSSRLKDFALAFGPVPGVKVDRSDLGTIEDGTGALAAIRADLKHLTKGQRAAVNAILNAPARAPRKARKASAGPWARAAGILAPTEQLRKLATEAEAYFAKELALKPTFTLDVRPALVGYKLKGSDGYGANAWAYPTDAEGSAAGPIKVCHVRFNTLLEYRGTDLEQTVAHEVFHCFQNQILGRSTASTAVTWAQDWLIEGGAEWASCTFAGGVNGQNWFATWAATPERILYGRSYDALGVFSELRKSTGINPFTTMAAALGHSDQAGIVGALAGGQQEKLLDDLGPSFLQQPTRFPEGDWDQQGECKSGAPPVPAPLLLAPQTQQSFDVPALAAKLLAPQPQGDALKLTVIAAAGRVRVSGVNGATGQPTDDLLSPDGTATRDYCMNNGGCACPGEAALPVLDPAADIKPVIAVTGDTVSGRVRVIAEKLACPVITAGEFKVDGATFHGIDGLESNPNVYDALLHWDDTFTGPMALQAGVPALCACVPGTHGGGTFTTHAPYSGDCQGTLSFENKDAPKDATMRVLSATGSGPSRTWTIQVEASSYGVPSGSDSACFPPPPFGRYHPDTLWQGTVTLTATGNPNSKTQSFPIASDPAHSSYENWAGTVTLTGVW